MTVFRNEAEQEEAMAHTSAADLAHGLKGAKFPMSKKDLAALARKNGVAHEVVQTIEEMPEGEYGSVTDVEHAFHQSQSGGARQSGTGGKGGATSAAQKGGQHSHKGDKSR
jgi:hypothetical protein